MPLAFWKTSSTAEGTKSPVLSGDANMLNLDPGSRDSGVFTFEQLGIVMDSHRSVLKENPGEVGGETVPVAGNDDKVAPMLRDERVLPDFGSGITSDESEPLTQPVPPVQQGMQRAEPSSLPLRQNPSTFPSSPRDHNDSTIKRLHRPTELNLSTTTISPKPQTELEKRFDVMRNSKSQLKAALRSPTQLLKERLNMSPRKSTFDETIRVFVPPQPPRDGCLLPGPGGRSEAFTSSSVRARTAGGQPAWWCKFDKLVVFDGIEALDDGKLKINTRTSKGLSIARRRGKTETIVIPMDCTHCQEMLRRSEWKYDIQVCKRIVCWDCKERCKWELEQERVERDDRTGRSRERADSVLQDDDMKSEELMRKMVIEEDRPESPMQVVGGIEERLDAMLCCK